MGAGAGVFRTIGVLAAAMALTLLGAPGAAAEEIDDSTIIAPQHEPHQADDGWQAGTCAIDTPPCSVDTPAQYFEQAAGHPPVGFTQILVKSEGGKPVGNLKTVRVDLPVGLSVNPQATAAQCEVGAGEHPDSTTCPLASKVGESQVTVSDLLGAPVPLVVPVYNVVPNQGEPARFGFSLLGSDVYLEADVAWDGDFHEGFTIHAVNLEEEGLPLPPLGELLAVRLLKNRLVFDGRSGDGTFITTPSTCYDPEGAAAFAHVYSTYLRADSYEDEDPAFPAGSPFIESPLPPGKKPLECDSIPFDPSIAVEPGSSSTDAPAGPRVDVDVPFEPDPLEQARSNLRKAEVTLPAGMGLNPSAANGLQTCSDAQFGIHTRNPVACPAASKVGTVAIETPPLPEGSLGGEVYVARQFSRDPLSGEEYRIFVHAASQRYGVSVRLAGHVAADPRTGVLTTTFDDSQFGGLPQVPFSRFVLDFDDGPHAVLTTPPTCGPSRTASRMTPWSGNPAATPGAAFSLTSAPGGGGCARQMGERPFAPGFSAHASNPRGGTFTDFSVGVGRADGEQELKSVDVTLPPGLTAKLAGVRYCPEATIAAAAANAGTAESAAASCPGASLVGSAAVAAGAGPDPVQIAGRVFLAGPYHGAPLSLAVITPATAGPFDLGTAVVRVALFVDPRTAQVTAVSDPIPHVFGGANLHVRSVDVSLDRPRFGINPTSCAPLAVGAGLHGGGANPLDPGAFSSFGASAPFQVGGCERLGFRPKLYMRVFGGTRRAKSPKLRAILVARDGDANIGRAAVTLPKALYLEQASLANVCTRVQFAAHRCPRDSIYGFARAYTPLLDGPLQGPVYLRSSDNQLPDMVASLHGQVDIELAGRIDSVKGRIRNTFDVVPDVPVSKFILTVRGGKRRGLLVNSRNLCTHRYKAVARFRGQNGKHANVRPKLRAPCRHKKHRHHRAKRR